MKKEEVPQNISAFPIGEENVGFKQYFTGESWLARLTNNKDLNVPMSNVTFELGCRNNWHSHTGGQILIAVGGVGYYQERGKDQQEYMAGTCERPTICRSYKRQRGNRTKSYRPRIGRNIW